MRRSNRLAVAVLAPAALMCAVLVASCAGGGTKTGGESASPDTSGTLRPDPSATAGPRSTAAPDASPAEHWLTSFCVAFVSYGEDVSALGDGFAVSNTASADQLKTALVLFLSDALTRTQRFKKDVDGLGAAPISDGQKLQGELSKAAAKVATIFDSALTDARGLDTADRPSLASRASDISARIEAGFSDVGNAFDVIDTKYDTGELSQAADGIPACATLFR